MARLRGAVTAALEGDGTLMAILTGGVYDRRGISRTATPDAYDSRGELLPCAVVAISSDTPIGPAQYETEQTFFNVYFYEAEGNAYAGIDAAKERVKAVLHQGTVSIDDGQVLEIRHADGIGDSYDEILKAEMSYLRFYAWRHRT
jgi:hypothetical protein